MVEDINLLLETILNDFVNNTGNFLLSAKLIAGIGAIIMGFITYRKIMMDGDVNGAINAFVIRCFLVGFGIMFYGTFLKMVNAPLNLMTAQVKQISLDQYETTTNIFTERITNPDDGMSENSDHDKKIAQLLNEENTASSDDAESEGVLSAVLNIGEQITGVFQQIVFQTLMFIASTALIILNVVRTFFLIVLSLFGIFVIALSMYPGLEGSFGQWLQKYINIYIWLAIAYILDGVLSRLFEMHASFNAANPATTLNGGFIMILALCAIISYATVPTMASWLVNASTNGMASKVKGKGEAMGQAIKKAATKGTA